MGKKAFTLVELLVGIIIIGILAAMGTAFFRADYGRQRQCAANLRVTFNALEAYRDATGQYPDDSSGALKTALYPAYISNADVFKCPADASAAEDSYSLFYVKPSDDSSMNTFVLGCPRHENGQKAINLFFQGQILKYEVAPVTANGVSVSPGDLVSGDLVFADGTTATVLGGTAILIQSFYITKSKCYSILKATSPGVIIDSDVVAGARYEIITPSAVAGVGGTFFRVIVYSAADTYIGVKEGEVYAVERLGKGRSSVRSDEVVLVKKGSPPKKYEPANKGGYLPSNRPGGKGKGGGKGADKGGGNDK